ncbi:Metallo-dependent phosphatase-like protein [Cunninghamella echinulata]|nr:Metallo-dependent phosphatase-like protein [Cunninghamella echinulata]
MTQLTPKEKRKWTLVAIGVGIIIILIVIIVPTATILTSKNRDNNDSNQGDYPIPPYAKQVSKFANLTRVKQLNELESKKNIYVFGDIHGCPKELQELATKIGYNQSTDAIILAGDLTTKGPDTPGALRKAKELGAYCVRGNHDDYVIRFKTYENLYGAEKMGPKQAILPEGDVTDPMKFKNDHAEIARSLSLDDYNYLVSCPMVIDLPFLNARVVHGGLDPNIENISYNDPWTVFNMRDINSKEVPIRDNEIGHHWTKDYEVVQSNRTVPVKVYYGHDASRGLDLHNITFGLDSGCVYGGKLSAINIKTNQLHQISCPKYSDN